MDWPCPVPPRAGSVAGEEGVSGVREHHWHAANLDRTSTPSAISPSDPVEDSEPGLSAQDRRASDNLPPHSALLLVRTGPNLGARCLLDSDTTIAGRHPNC